jgi:hypothetical protein
VTSTLSRYRDVIGVRLDERRLLAWTRNVAAGLLAFFLAAGTLVAVTVPFHVWDALAYGSWSRLVAETGNLHFRGLGALEYQRPFYYVLQGWLWRATGFDERTGRLLALAFAVLFAACVVQLARMLGRTAWEGVLAALLLLLVHDFVAGGVSGLSDVPVAALVALAGMLAWRPRPGAATVTLLVLVTAAAVLTKPTALFALVGLGCAQLVGSRAGLGSRLLLRAAPLAGGCALALAWHELQAHRLALSLPTFLKAGTTGGYYAALSDSVRRQVGFGLDWLSPELRLVLAFALAYAVVRVAGWAHRPAAIAALPMAVIASWLGPWIGGGEATLAVGPFSGPGRLVPFLVLAGLLAFASDAPPEKVPERTTLARLLLWSVPPTAVWLLYLPYGARYLSPAWPGLVVLCALATAPAVTGAFRRGVLVPSVALLVLAALVARNAEQIDGLDTKTWKRIRAAGVSGWFDQGRMRTIVMGSFADELELTRRHLGSPHARVFSSDGRLRFYFPGRTTQAYAGRCADLRGYAVFVLLTDPTSVGYEQSYARAPADPRSWSACRDPRLTPVGRQERRFVVFSVERD